MKQKRQCGSFVQMLETVILKISVLADLSTPVVTVVTASVV